MNTIIAITLLVIIVMVVLFVAFIAYEMIKTILDDIKGTLTALTGVIAMFVVPSLIVIWLGAGLVAFGLLNAFTIALLTVTWFVYSWAIQELF